MVRKRSRTTRKYYDDDDNDSDSDFALEEPAREPAQKKYSLRQRKRRIFTEFEFDDDGDEIEPTKVPSDDDDFEVEKELELDETPGTEYINNQAHYVEPDENEEVPEDADGLIDFEDMIRADIVVNKNRIDYDNLIQKTEIKVQPLEETEQPLILKSKRGRKPKVRSAEEIDSSLLEPETEMQEAEYEDKNDKDYNPDDDVDEPIDCAKLMEAELSESASELQSVHSNTPINPNNNESNSENNLTQANETETPQEKEIIPDNLADNVSNEVSDDICITQNQVTTEVESNLSKENQESTEINGKVSPSVCPNSPPTNEELLSVAKSDIVDIDDDDVVLVEDEKKCEVIVLDD